MARTVYLSFLGIGGYISCNYTAKGYESIKKVNFIQEATIQINKNDIDTVYIFCTESALLTNWEDNCHPYTKYEGLKTRLKNLGMLDKTKTVDIPDGFTEEEIWQIFDIISNVIKDGDDIIIDITHALRYQPMLGIVVMNYLRVIKNVKVKAIYYGAFESLGNAKDVSLLPIEKRNAPILNLKSFSDLQEWTNATDLFVNYGNYKRLENILRKEDSEENVLLKNAQDVTLQFSTARGASIIEGRIFTNLKGRIKGLKKKLVKRNVPSPFINLTDFMSSSIKKYDENSSLNGFQAVHHCIECGLTQQGITLLLEMIVSFLLIKKENAFQQYSTKQPWKDKELRTFVSSALSTEKEEYRSRAPKLEPLNSEYEKYLELLRAEKNILQYVYTDEAAVKLRNVYQELAKLRNDINHAGMRSDRKAESFETDLVEHYNITASIINELENSQLQIINQ